MTHIRKILAACWLGAAAQLAALPATAADPGAMPGDAAMTCQQIAAELAPYAQQLAPDLASLAQTDEQLLQRSQARSAGAAATAAAVSAGAAASSLDPTGLSSRAYGQAEASLQRQMWNRALAEDKPLTDQAKRQADAAVAKAAPMQSNPRLQRLMQLAKEKDCQ
jgi:hypothetical protein